MNFQELSKGPFFILGPCVIENQELLRSIAAELARLRDKFEVPVIFKASYDKANRTSVSGYRGPGMREGLQMLADIIAGRANAAGQPGAAPSLSATLSCVWGSSFDGEFTAAQVEDLVGRIAELGVAEIALADTIGAGDPWAVTKKVEAARAAAPDAVLRLHFHDTRNTGLANAFAGIEAGVSVLDASVGGIGGCPFAPGATGNIATEDLVYMLERAGYSTGHDLDALINTARWIGEKIGRPAPSALSRAGGWPPRRN